MREYYTALQRQHSPTDVVARMMRALEPEGADLGALTQDDLAPLDQFHSRGLDATLELAGLAGVTGGARLLDVGCGVGGPARTLASRFGCRVTGVDFVAESVRAARELTRSVGLARLVDFQQASALDLPFDDATFDIVWTQHASMNVRDKRRFYAELGRVLRPGGRLAIHDICSGQTGPPDYPLPWADDPSISHLTPLDEARRLLEAEGLRPLVWNDATAATVAWLSARQSGGPGLDRLRAIWGDDFPRRGDNSLRGMREGRLAVLIAVLERPG